MIEPDFKISTTCERCTLNYDGDLAHCPYCLKLCDVGVASLKREKSAQQIKVRPIAYLFITIAMILSILLVYYNVQH